MQLLRFDAHREHRRYERVSLLPASAALRSLSRAGSLDGRCYLLFVAARKTAGSTGTVIPQQRSYLEMWPEFAALSTAAGAAAARLESEDAHQGRGKMFKKLARRTKLTRALYRWVTTLASPTRVAWQRI